MAETIYVGRSLVIASANPIKSANVTIGTGSITSNLTSGSLIVTSPLRAPTLPLYTEAATQPSVASGGDEWLCTSNSNLFQYSSGIWNLLVSFPIPALYTFTTATFTPGGATGQNGPTLSQARSGLTGTPAPSGWSGTYLDMSTQGIMLWTVPATGLYTIQVAGAKGGNANSYAGGNGRVVSATFSLTKNQVIKILVGQPGNTIYRSDSPSWGGSGGGGTFVTDSSNNILIIGGGGGGAKQNVPWSAYANGQDATFQNYGLTSTGGSGASGGNGGLPESTSGCSGGGGGGYSGNGGVSTTCFIPVIAYSFLNGGVGGSWYYNGYWNADQYAYGGFGGGGACVNDNACRPGGGGGYSGGGGSDYDSTKSGGGAGYYSAGTSTTNIGTNNGAGYVTITRN